MNNQSSLQEQLGIVRPHVRMTEGTGNKTETARGEQEGQVKEPEATSFEFSSIKDLISQSAKEIHKEAEMSAPKPPSKSNKLLKVALAATCTVMGAACLFAAKKDFTNSDKSKKFTL